MRCCCVAPLSTGSPINPASGEHPSKNNRNDYHCLCSVLYKFSGIVDMILYYQYSPVITDCYLGISSWPYHLIKYLFQKCFTKFCPRPISLVWNSNRESIEDFEGYIHLHINLFQNCWSMGLMEPQKEMVYAEENLWCNQHLLWCQKHKWQPKPVEIKITEISSVVACVSTHLPLVLHICVSEVGHHWSRSWLFTWSAPVHCLNQCLLIVNWTPGNIFQWKLNPNSIIFIQEMHL